MLIILLRKKLKVVFLGNVTAQQKEGKSSEDSYGHEVLVTTRLMSGKPGKVEYKGSPGTPSPMIVSKLNRVKIIDRNGLRFKVERL